MVFPFPLLEHIIFFEYFDSMNTEIKCPKCGSNQLSADKKGLVEQRLSEEHCTPAIFNKIALMLYDKGMGLG